MSKDLQYFERSTNLSRRALAKITLGGAAAMVALDKLRAANALSYSGPSGVKLTGQGSVNPTDDDLKFFNEVGYKYVYAFAPRSGDMMTVDQMKAAKKRYSDAGIVLHNIRYLLGGPGGNDVNVLLLNLPGADQALERVKEWIRRTGKNGAGFDYTG